MSLGIVVAEPGTLTDERRGNPLTAGLPQHLGFQGGKSADVAPNALQRAFEVDGPNKVWVTDFTYIRTSEGWLYLTIVLDLFSRQIIGWSIKANARADLVLDTLLMAMWRRKPKSRVLFTLIRSSSTPALTRASY